VGLTVLTEEACVLVGIEPTPSMLIISPGAMGRAPRVAECTTVALATASEENEGLSVRMRIVAESAPSSSGQKRDHHIGGRGKEARRSRLSFTENPAGTPVPPAHR